MKKVTRYRVLRNMGFDPIVSSFVAFVNFMWGVPEGVIGVMNVIIEYDVCERGSG